MMIQNGDGTMTMGPFDVVLILQSVQTGRFHVCLLEESPPPGPIAEVQDTKVVRLKSRMHHTTGSDSFAGAVTHLDDLTKKLQLQPGNVVRDRCYPKDGDMDAFMLLTPNWKPTTGGCFRDALPGEDPAPSESTHAG